MKNICFRKVKQVFLKVKFLRGFLSNLKAYLSEIKINVNWICILKLCFLIEKQVPQFQGVELT